ncbi:MAG: septation protein SpoVG family protein [Firmicutes bacterium]|nr:septation protein SpoVG family protein [Bacillota bacterium]
MEITEVRFRRSLRENKVLASVSVVFDRSFVVHELRVIEGVNGAFVSMPARRTASGEYLDLAHPVTAEFREQLQSRVLAAYRAWAAQRAPAAAAAEAGDGAEAGVGTEAGMGAEEAVAAAGGGV